PVDASSFEIARARVVLLDEVRVVAAPGYPVFVKERHVKFVQVCQEIDVDPGAVADIVSGRPDRSSVGVIGALVVVEYECDLGAFAADQATRREIVIERLRAEDIVEALNAHAVRPEVRRDRRAQGRRANDGPPAEGGD